MMAWRARGKMTGADNDETTYPVPSGSRLRTVGGLAPIYLGFAATGVGVALPGAVLPVLAARWHMNDAASGRLFLMAWIGSSAGALLVRGSLRRSLCFGAIAVAAGAAGLGCLTREYGYFCMLVYGCGLGAAMTAISLIRQQQAPHVGSEFVRLNLVWATGALLAPALAASALAGGSLYPTFLGLGAAFLLLAGWTFALPSLRLEQTAGAAAAWRVFTAVPWQLILMVALATGIEASAGGWLATYARRSEHQLAATVAAPTCLWAGLLLSRLFWSIRDRWLPADVVVRASVLLTAVSSVLLLTSHNAFVMLVSAFGIGFGLGPIYPLLLAWALRFHRGGAIFFLAGVGSSTLPWMTGAVSSARGSLRLGLGVPVAGALLMAALAFVLPLRRWRTEVVRKVRRITKPANSTRPSSRSLRAGMLVARGMRLRRLLLPSSWRVLHLPVRR